VPVLAYVIVFAAPVARMVTGLAALPIVWAPAMVRLPPVTRRLMLHWLLLARVVLPAT
jgi:hypothetical protein